MILRALIVLLTLAATPAAAQTFICPRVQIGWAKQWPTSQITSASYDSGAKVIYIVQAHTIPEAYAQVPTSVITQFSNTQDPYSVYLGLRAQYPQILLTQKDNCPILQQDGNYVYTNTVPLNYFLALLKETYGDLLQENGDYLFLENPAPQYGPYIGLAQENDGLIVQENFQPLLTY